MHGIILRNWMTVQLFVGSSLHGVLAKIIFRACVTRDGAICIQNGRFEYFDGTNPITGKGDSYSILQRFWVMWYLNVASMLAAQVTRRSRMYTWLNKRSVLVLSTFATKREKNLQRSQFRQIGKDPRWKLLNFVGDQYPARMTQLIHVIKQPH